MGFDGFNFSTVDTRPRRHDAPVAIICACGKATVNHTIRERQRCAEDDD